MCWTSGVGAIGGLWLSPTLRPVRGSTTTPFQAAPLGSGSVLGAVVLLPTTSVSLLGRFQGWEEGQPQRTTCPPDPPHEQGSETQVERAETASESTGKGRGLLPRVLDAASADRVHRALFQVWPTLRESAHMPLPAATDGWKGNGLQLLVSPPAPSSSSPFFPEVPHTCLHPRRDCYSGSQTWPAVHGLR